MQKHDDGAGLSAEEIVPQLTLGEKIRLMTPKSSFLELIWQAVILKHYNKKPVRAGGNKRFKIPEIRFCDGPRGLVSSIATCFPVSIARAASFDTDLEERIGRAVAAEVRAVGGNFYGGVCVNIPRHPAWGRSQESYGEDPCLAGAFGSALVRGVTYHNVVACVKHFALNSMEDARFRVNIECSERTLREVYLPHFRRCVEAGAGCVMGAYNKFRGEYCCQNSYLLKNILKNEWGFSGFTMSDFLRGIKDTEKAANAGMDVEMPIPRHYGKKLIKAVKNGKVKPRIVDDAAMRIASTMLAAKRAVDPAESYPRTLLACKEHVRLAATAAERSMTLIRNENDVLPFDLKTIRTLAVFGKPAKRKNLGDHGSSRVHPPYAVTPLKGLKKLWGGERNLLYNAGDDAEQCRGIAGRCDAAVFVVGYDHTDEGEYLDNPAETPVGDRASLRLRPEEVNLIKRAAPANPRSVVVLVGGGTILIDEWKDDVPAILMAFYPGMEGGNAIAATLAGLANPGGKLPFVIPKSEADLPPFDRHADEMTYGYYHGYAKLDADGVEPSYHFGYGLSYSRFEVSNASFCATAEGVTGSCEVKNVSERTGDEVIQLYIGFENSKVDRPVKLLRGFTRVTLKPGEKREVELFCAKDDLAWYNPDSSAWEVEDIEYRGYIGTSADPAALKFGAFRL